MEINNDKHFYRSFPTVKVRKDIRGKLYTLVWLSEVTGEVIYCSKKTKEKISKQLNLRY